MYIALCTIQNLEFVYIWFSNESRGFDHRNVLDHSKLFLDRYTGVRLTVFVFIQETTHLR